LAPDSFTTLAHLATSSRRNFACSAGVLGEAS